MSGHAADGYASGSQPVKEEGKAIVFVGQLMSAVITAEAKIVLGIRRFIIRKKLFKFSSGGIGSKEAIVFANLDVQSPRADQRRRFRIAEALEQRWIHHLNARIAEAVVEKAGGIIKKGYGV